MVKFEENTVFVDAINITDIVILELVQKFDLLNILIQFQLMP